MRGVIKASFYSPHPPLSSKRGLKSTALPLVGRAIALKSD